MELSLTKLQHLVAVARCGGFSRAAAELNLSQPALSRSIGAIEDRYGVMLFNRVGHGVEPTAAGLQVLEQARPMLQQLLVFESNLKLLGDGCAGRLDMGMAPLMASQLVPRLTAQLISANADIQLRVAVRPGEELLLALRSGEVEVIVYPERHLPETDEVDVQQLGLVQPICVVRSGHPLLGRGSLQLDDLSGYPWASSMETSLAPQVKSRSRLVCDNYHILREAIMASDLVCICSKDFVAEQLAGGTLAEIVVSELSLRPTKIFVARLKGRVHSPLASRALDTIQTTLAGWWQDADQIATAD